MFKKTQQRILSAMSFSEIRRVLCNALTEARPGKYGDIVDVYPDYVIVTEGNELYEVPYVIDEKGVISMGEWAKVRKQVDYVKVTAASQVLAPIGQETSTDYGYKWQVQIIEAGVDRQGIANYPIETLRVAVSLYEGAKVFALSQGQHDDPKNPFGKSVRDLVGWLSDVRANDKGLEGMLNLTDDARWLRDKLVSAFKKGKTDLLGLSHDVMARVDDPKLKPATVQAITRVDSVDVVYDPIAGGKFLRMAAAQREADQKKEANMLKKLLAALKEKRPDLKNQIEALEAKGDAMTEDEVMALVASATEKRAEGDVQGEKIRQDITNLVASLKDVTVAQAKETIDKAQKLYEDTIKLNACSNILIQTLNDCGLPSMMKIDIQKQFEGKVFDEKDLQAAIKHQKDICDQLTGSGAPNGVGGLRMEVGPGEPEKLQAAFDKLLGVDVDEKYKDVPSFNSLRAAYTRLTGDPELRGIPSREGMKLGEAFMNMLRLPAAYSTSTFSFVLGNSMYRRLIKEYNAVSYREDVLISFYRNAQDFRNMEIIQVGYFGDVPDVNPENADYQEITMPTDVEAIYAINQKGWILTVTRRVIMNDDLKTVTQLVAKMGRAHRRTHARRAWNKIISNANFDGDATPLFDVSHGNLGAVTLTNDATGIATLTARLQALYAQTEQDSGEGLALEALYLWCPRELLEIAKALNSPWPIAGTYNPHARRFGDNHERIICNPLFIDANDWGLVANGGDVELLEAAYINGRREPEFFVADNPVVGQMFVADKIQYKSRHEFEFEIADYRGFDKSVIG